MSCIHRECHVGTVLALLAALGMSSAQGLLFSQDLRIAANDSFMPFSYPDESNKPVGIAVTVVEDLLARAKIGGQVQLYPFQRLMAMAEEPNTLCFAIFRTPERERKYKWIAPVTLPVHSVLVRLKSRYDIKVETLEDAKKYRIGVINGNNLQTLLENAGFAAQLQPVPLNEQNYKKLFSGRIDLMALRESSLTTELKTLGFSIDDVEIAFKLNDDGPAWLIASLQTPDAVVARIQAAYEASRKDRFLEKTTGLFLDRFK